VGRRRAQGRTPEVFKRKRGMSLRNGVNARLRIVRQPVYYGTGLQARGFRGGRFLLFQTVVLEKYASGGGGGIYSFYPAVF